MIQLIWPNSNFLDLKIAMITTYIAVLLLQYRHLHFSMI